MYPPFDPILFQAGPITLRWYGILIVTGILLAAWVAARYVERKGQSGDALWDLLLWILIPGLIGARLYYVFIQSPRGENGLGYYLSNPWAILEIWSGGIHIFGAFIFGGIAAVLYMRRQGLPALIYLDAIALGLPLGQAIGRWANFINQELYGPPTTLPWGLEIDPGARIPPYNDMTTYPPGTLFHPLFLYESLWNFLGFGLLFWISRRFEHSLRPGDLLLLYIIWYPTGRFLLEFLRTDSWFFPGTPFNVVHLLAGAAVITAIVILVRRHSRPTLVEAPSR
jgi:phosphatidylglycerol---prolipoprotein diacylglyceryl transferase